MKVVLIMDKFKESLSATEVAEAIFSGLSSKNGVSVCSIPLADGGDGTIEALDSMVGFEKVWIDTVDPLGRKITVPVLKGTRFICEMAQSTALVLLSEQERDPLRTSSYGFGSVIKTIAKMGAEEIIAGIGGSATNDCGAGMLQALGYRFYDRNGNIIRGAKQNGEEETELLSDTLINGGDLADICKIDDALVSKYVKSLKITVASDVTNPLTGVYGATRVYGPQKGAGVDAVERLEAGVVNFAGVAEKFLGSDNSTLSGSGAAGGVGFALNAFLRAELKPGWRVLFDMLDVEEKVRQADLIITGEGRVDGQSLSGKLLSGVSAICNKYKKRLWVICGDNLLTERELKRAGIERLYSVSQIEPMKELAIKNARQYLYDIARRLPITN